MELITSQTCSKCRNIKKWIDDNHLQVRYVNIEDLTEPEVEAIAQSGINSLPILHKDGKYIALAPLKMSEIEGLLRN